MDLVLHKLYSLLKQFLRKFGGGKILQKLQHSGKHILILQVSLAFKRDEAPVHCMVHDHIKASFMLQLVNMIDAVIAGKRICLLKQKINSVTVVDDLVHCSQI